MGTVRLNYSLRQLGYFVVTAESLSFTAAAKILHVSQPSISAAISELESTFGVQLFIRHHAQGLSMTQAGRDMLSRARDLLKCAEELQTTAKEFDLGLKGTIAMGCMVSLAPILAPSLTSGFLKAHPSMSLSIREGNQEELLQDLRSGVLDVALTYDLELTSDIRFTSLLRLPPYAILPKNHPLAAHSTVSLDELRGDPFIMLDLPHSREYFSGLLTTHGGRAAAAFRSSQPEVVRGMVANGLGYSILNFPVRASTAIDGYEFVVKRFREKLHPLTLGIAYSKGAMPRNAVRIFAVFCETEIRSLRPAARVKEAFS